MMYKFWSFLIMMVAFAACQSDTSSTDTENKLVDNQVQEEMPSPAVEEQMQEMVTDTIITMDPLTKNKLVKTLERPKGLTADRMPSFNGCETENSVMGKLGPCTEVELKKFVSKTMKYPEKAVLDKIEGTVIASFVVDTNGRAVQPNILEPLCDVCDAAVIELIGMMPPWQPGVYQGQKVPVTVNLPVLYKF